jgi:hypothetical protein
MYVLFPSLRKLRLNEKRLTEAELVVGPALSLNSALL